MVRLARQSRPNPLLLKCTGFPTGWSSATRYRAQHLTLHARIETLSVYLYNTDKGGRRMMKRWHTKAIFQTIWSRHCDWKTPGWWRVSKSLFSGPQVPMLTLLPPSIPWPLVDNFPPRTPLLVCVTPLSIDNTFKFVVCTVLLGIDRRQARDCSLEQTTDHYGRFLEP